MPRAIKIRIHEKLRRRGISAPTVFVSEKLERTLRNGYLFLGKRKLLLKQFTATSSDEIDNNNNDDDDNDQNNTLIYER